MGAACGQFAALPALAAIVKHGDRLVIVSPEKLRGNRSHRVKIRQVWGGQLSRRRNDLALQSPEVAVGPVLCFLVVAACRGGVRRGSHHQAVCPRAAGLRHLTGGAVPQVAVLRTIRRHRHVIARLGRGRLIEGLFLQRTVLQQERYTHRQHQHRRSAAPASPLQPYHTALFLRGGSRRFGSPLLLGVHSLKQRRRRKGGGQGRTAGTHQLVGQPFPVGIQFLFTVRHDKPSFPSGSCKNFRSLCSERDSLLLTVPCGSPSIPAISRIV